MKKRFFDDVSRGLCNDKRTKIEEKMEEEREVCRRRIEKEKKKRPWKIYEESRWLQHRRRKSLKNIMKYSSMMELKNYNEFINEKSRKRIGTTMKKGESWKDTERNQDVL